MNLNFVPKPFSTFELVAGSAALAPVALIAILGLKLPQSQNPLPAVPSSLSATSVLLSQSVSWPSGEQFSERSQSAGVTRKPRSVDSDSDSEGDNLILPEQADPNATSSAAADSPPIAPARRLGRWGFDDASGAERRLIEAGLLWGFSDGMETMEPQDRQCGSSARKSFATSCDPNSVESRTPLEQNSSSRRSGGEDAFVGGWADDIGECRQYQSHGAPLVISTHAAKTVSGKCDFQFIRREAASRWRIVALCSREGETWTAHVDLALAGSNLIWSSERGVAKYVRCLRP